MECIVIFGGTGFIGSFFANEVKKKYGHAKIYLLDIESFSEKDSEYRLSLIEENDSFEYIKIDVRNKIDWLPEEKVILIANFAAVHREPGHEAKEYYETNILGAENICSWAEQIKCDTIIFSSSISIYGSSNESKNENYLASPDTPYGVSKLLAEKIHEIWLHKDKNRKLAIARPGVVFGPSEGGNVTRLIKAVKKGYFFFAGNKKIIKSGIYVKELCSAMMWVLSEKLGQKENFILFNLSMNEELKLEDYVNAIRLQIYVFLPVLNIPFYILLAASYTIDFVTKLLKFDHTFKPTRIRKLISSNDIKPEYLLKNKYIFKYTLDESFADWKKDFKDDWK